MARILARPWPCFLTRICSAAMSVPLTLFGLGKFVWLMKKKEVQYLASVFPFVFIDKFYNVKGLKFRSFRFQVSWRLVLSPKKKKVSWRLGVALPYNFPCMFLLVFYIFNICGLKPKTIICGIFYIKINLFIKQKINLFNIHQTKVN